MNKGVYKYAQTQRIVAPKLKKINAKVNKLLSPGSNIYNTALAPFITTPLIPLPNMTAPIMSPGI